ncbi:MAG: SBBP repeat-containing protein, partial [Acidobacteriota bacterium]
MKSLTKWGIVGLAAVVILAALPAMAGEGPTARPDQNQQLRVVDAYGKLPMSFEANRGQADPSVRFLARGSGYGLFLGKNGVQLSLAGTSGGRGATADAAAHLTLSLLGTNRSSSVEGVDLLPGRVNYFLGSDPAKWRTDIPTFEKVRYEEIYAGVDMLCYGNQRQLEFDFVVKPGADPTAIHLAFKGAKGLRLSPEGDLLISMPGGEVVQRRPVVYQDVDGQRCLLGGSYVMVSPSVVGFRLGPYDRTRPVIIDPVLAYSTFLGGTGNDYGQRIAVDASGNAYVVGYTSSNPFPGTAGSAIQPAYAGGTNDAFVTKIDPAGTTILYSTYLGGSGDDEAYGIALDGNGDAYITGGTNSPNYPIKYPYQLYSGGGYDVFVTEINSVGNDLVFSTYLGGKTGDDGGYGIALDPGGDVYVDGNTNSTDFPVIFPIQAACNPGPMHAFLSRFHFNSTTDALSLVYSTYLGGSGTDRALALAVDATGAYVAGPTTSPDFPTLNAFQGNLKGPQNAFLCKVAFSGSVLSFVYSTYLGGTGTDQANAVRVDGSGNAIIVGSTSSLDFPLLNPFQPLYAGNGDAFISKFTPSGGALVFSTYLGGSDADQAQDVALDSSGNVYIVGATSSIASSPSIAFPLANPISSPTGGGEAFVTELNPTGNLMANSTFLSGSAQDAALGVAVDSSGAAYVTGLTNSSDFPTTAGALQTVNGGNTDAFLSKLVVPGGTCTLGCAASVPAAGYVGQPIAFTSALTQANCSSVTYDWDWGDQTTHGNTATGNHTYT